MLRISDIETEVQFLADESNLVISSGANLPILNGYYKMFCRMRLWPELNITDTSVVLTAGQEAYQWPTTHIFQTEPALILQRTVGNPRNFVKVWPVQDEIYWGFLKNVVQSFPSHYKKERLSAGEYSLLMRPVSNVTGLQLLIVGQIEPDLFVQSTDTTVFKEEQSDRAFSRFLAAQWQKKRNNSGRAAELIDEMEMLLPEGDFGPTARPNNIIPWWT